MTDKLHLGISACLLGEQVRFDGGHKRDRYLKEVLAPFVVWHPVCPERSAGMGVPRETVRLVGSREGVRLVAPRSQKDWSDAMRDAGRELIADLAAHDLDGFVVKSKSPTCGLERVKRYGDDGGAPAADGQGMFATMLIEAMPTLPMEEEGRLRDPVLRESFLRATFGYRRWKQHVGASPSVAALVAFHGANKYLLHSHSPGHMRALGRLVARSKGMGALQAAHAYLNGFLAALRGRATVGRHVDVLTHMAGYFKNRIAGSARAELHESIADYRHGFVPRSVPMALLRHHAREQQIVYLSEQSYFQPYPKALMAGLA